MKKLIVCILLRGQICQSQDLLLEGSGCSRQHVARERAFSAIYWAFFSAFRDRPTLIFHRQEREPALPGRGWHKGPLRSASAPGSHATAGYTWPLTTSPPPSGTAPTCGYHRGWMASPCLKEERRRGDILAGEGCLRSLSCTQQPQVWELWGVRHLGAPGSKAQVWSQTDKRQLFDPSQPWTFIRAVT